MPGPAVELIQYVDEDGTPTGETAEKLAAHTADTRLHLAFSCYIFDTKGRLLVTRRADIKKVWPGVWTNSCCGHPMPNESFADAIRRRLAHELGITDLTEPECILPEYMYKTPPLKGIIEHEFCPVFVAFLRGDISPNPDEVGDYSWLTWAEYQQDLTGRNQDYSYWCKDQFPRIDKAVQARINSKT